MTYQAPNGRNLTLTAQDKVEIIDVIWALREVVEEAGSDYIYPGSAYGGNDSCVYVKQGQASCIAAKVLVKLGADVQQLALWEGQACDYMSKSPNLQKPSGQFDMPDVSPLEMGWPAYNVLRRAQVRQDSACTWGESLAAAVALATVYGVLEDSAA